MRILDKVKPPALIKIILNKGCYMSTNDRNASIVNKAKRFLKEYGYDVKISHLYNVFSKLSNESSWNVAKAKGTEFNNILEKQEDLKVSGSNKTIPAIEINSILERMTRTLYFYLSMSGDFEPNPAHFFKTFIKSSKVIKGKDESIKFMEKLYEEYICRRKSSPTSIVKFNPIIICIDEFYNFSEKWLVDRQTMEKLKEILMYGRSVGFILYSSSSRATKSDVPSGISMEYKNVFKISDEYSKNSTPEINFVGSFDKIPAIDSEDLIISGMFYPEIITRLKNYDPNTFKFNCAKLTKNILDSKI